VARGQLVLLRFLSKNRIVKTAVIFAKIKGIQAGISEQMNYR
jgi:hypothetical protein